MLVGVGLRDLPVWQTPVMRHVFHISHLSFGSPATRGISGRVCGFVSHAFAWFTLVETEPTSGFSIFRKLTASSMRKHALMHGLVR